MNAATTSKRQTSLPSHPVSPLTAAVLALTLLLAACGGGGGAATDATVTPVTPVVPVPVDLSVMPEAANAVIISSQEAANALVRDAEQRTRDLQLASGLAGATTPGATPAAALPGVALRAQAGTKQALALRDITGDLCSQGTASVDLADALLSRFVADANAQLQAGDELSFKASNCVVKAALELGSDVALGNFGVGAIVTGSFVLNVEQSDATQQLLRLTYTDFRWQPVGEAAFDPLSAVIRFGVQNGVDVFALDLPGRRFLTAPLVVAQNGLITVSQGSLRTALPAAAGSLYGDYTYADWRYVSTTGHANAGSVTVQGAGVQRAVITASTSGYVVTITTAAGSQTYTVSP
jgi:hypothetical protein